LLNYQNNYVENSSVMSNAAKNFDILATSLNILYNYFDNPTKLFLNLNLVKFLNTSAKSFFLYTEFHIFLMFSLYILSTMFVVHILLSILNQNKFHVCPEFYLHH